MAMERSPQIAMQQPIYSEGLPIWLRNILLTLFSTIALSIRKTGSRWNLHSDISDVKYRETGSEL